MRTSTLRRVMGPVAAAGLALLIAAQPAWAAVSWKPTATATGTMRESRGMVLARSSTADRARLHLAAVSQRVNGEIVTDTGPYQAIEYRRSTDGVDWSSPRRLNAAGEHGDFAAVAAAGSRVYVVWRADTHIQDWFVPTDPRLIRLAVNDDHGDPGDWRSRKALTTSGRVDRPAIAATGRRVYVTYTDATSGEIRVQRSTDRGRTWETLPAIGATVSEPFIGDYGFVGLPVIAADGRNVVVAFHSDNGINLRRSTDGGDSWTSFVPTDADTYGYAVAARGDRIALAYLDEDGGQTRVRAPGGWQDWRTFTTFSATATYKAPDSTHWGVNPPAVALTGSAGLAVSWGACTEVGCGHGEVFGSSIRFRESTTNGTSWKAAKTLGTFEAGPGRRENAFPSLVVAGSTRWVSWTTQGGKDPNRRILVRRGIGSP